MDLGLKDRVALITGGSRGLGRELALAFADEGARVAICARDKTQLEAVAAEVSARGGTCFTERADLSDPAECRRTVDAVAQHFGRLDALVNNASASVDGVPGASFAGLAQDEMMGRIVGKAMVAVHCSYAAVPHMRHAGGRIVCIGGSSARSVARGRENPFTGLKSGLGNAAVANFARHLAEEVAGDGILVNVVHPHLTRTSRHPDRIKRLAAEWGLSDAETEDALAREIPIGRVIEPSDLTGLILYLASPRNGAVTGQSIGVDGGAVRTIFY